ncbi:uncharacterized protein LOC106461449 [Limulus polyphemus]|uniref:Uncharacterized protein LOC106461449 n=1 Tax=Limulus polyphemus TaxID=6850 RepID=A0ABM1B836_LIMPO|nr:uncharacterized protein LOC106461449 [Limulus polyphemus]
MFCFLLVLLLACGTVKSTLIEENRHSLHIDEDTRNDLLKFVVTNIEKLKVEHEELDECHGLEIVSLLRIEKEEKPKDGVRYYMTLKVQPALVATEDCVQKNATLASLEPEICEAEVAETRRKEKPFWSLLRSACLQVEELVD